MIIDVHTHIYPEKIADRAIAKLESAAGVPAKTNGRKAGLMDSMKKAGVDYSILLPVATSPGQVEKINEEAINTNRTALEDGLFSFGAVHPDTPDYKEVLRRIRDGGLKGIKLHPDYQDTFFSDIRYKRIVQLATELGLYVMVHCGVDIGLPDPIHCPPEQVVEMLEDTGSDHLILAHMGGWRQWDKVDRLLSGRDVYMDTAFSLSCIPGVEGMLSEEEFAKMVRHHGADRILFGTDSPWAGQHECVEWIKKTPLTSEEKEKIFSGNIRRILEI